MLMVTSINNLSSKLNRDHNMLFKIRKLVGGNGTLRYMYLLKLEPNEIYRFQAMKHLYQ